MMYRSHVISFNIFFRNVLKSQQEFSVHSTLNLEGIVLKLRTVW
jgi:hypothetical protein